MAKSTPARTLRAALFLLPLATAAVVWAPEFAHYHVPTPDVPDEAVAAALRSPDDEVLEELRELYILPYAYRDSATVVRVARGILEGRLEMPGLPAGSVTPTFSPEDLVGVPRRLRLWYAGYAVPDFLLAAHAETGREEFFDTARAFLRGWEAYESGARLPDGLVWNDHAIASRVRVLAEFWRQARGRVADPEETGRWVLEQAARLRALLADPAHFTFSTNHGMMQNLGLLQLELAFPTLPDWPRHRELALTRLDRQLAFLMDERGMIRENSAGYQAFGLEMLGMTLRTLTLLGEPVPGSWAERYRRGMEVLATLQRPDATLPANGDTDGSGRTWLPRATSVESGEAGPMRPRAVTAPDEALSVHPAAGYWIHWEGLEGWPDSSRLAQTVVTWTSPPAFGHKHADEPSVLVWSHGVSWLTSVGYWPYDLEGRHLAEGWGGANAPHLAGEATRSARRARLLVTGAGEGVALADLERRGPGGFTVRRQVVALEPDRWIVLDRTENAPPPGTSTVWTLSPEVELEEARTPGSWRLGVDGEARGRLEIVTGEEATLARARGSLAPFAGWHVIDLEPRPAPAVVVRQPAGEATAALLLEVGDAEPGAGMELEGLVVPERWTLTFPDHPELREVRREGDRLSVHLRGEDGTRTVALRPAPDPSQELEEIGRAYDAMAADYPRFRPLAPTRAKVSYVLVALFLFQELVLFAVRRLLPGLVVPVRALGVVCWIGVAGWLHLSFLRSHESLARPEATEIALLPAHRVEPLPAAPHPG